MPAHGRGKSPWKRFSHRRGEPISPPSEDDQVHPEPEPAGLEVCNPPPEHFAAIHRETTVPVEAEGLNHFLFELEGNEGALSQPPGYHRRDRERAIETLYNHAIAVLYCAKPFLEDSSQMEKITFCLKVWGTGLFEEECAIDWLCSGPEISNRLLHKAIMGCLIDVIIYEEKLISQLINGPNQQRDESSLRRVKRLHTDTTAILGSEKVEEIVLDRPEPHFDEDLSNLEILSAIFELIERTVVDLFEALPAIRAIRREWLLKQEEALAIRSQFTAQVVATSSNSQNIEVRQSEFAQVEASAAEAQAQTVTARPGTQSPTLTIEAEVIPRLPQNPPSSNPPNALPPSPLPGSRPPSYNPFTRPPSYGPNSGAFTRPPSYNISGSTPSLVQHSHPFRSDTPSSYRSTWASYPEDQTFVIPTEASPTFPTPNLPEAPVELSAAADKDEDVFQAEEGPEFEGNTLVAGTLDRTSITVAQPGASIDSESVIGDEEDDEITPLAFKDISRSVSAASTVINSNAPSRTPSVSSTYNGNLRPSVANGKVPVGPFHLVKDKSAVPAPAYADHNKDKLVSNIKDVWNEDLTGEESNEVEKDLDKLGISLLGGQRSSLLNSGIL